MTRLVPIVCGQVFTLVVGVLGLKLVSQFLSPEIFGTYALLLTLTGLGMQFTHAGLYNHAIRCWQREAAVNRAAYLGFLWREHWRATGPLVWLVTGVGVGVGLWQGEAFWLWSVSVLVLANVAQTSSGLAQGVLNAAERHWAVFGVTGSALATRTLLPLAAVAWLGPSLPVLMSGLGASAMTVTCLLLALAGPAGRRRDADAVAQARWTDELRGYTQPYFWLGVGGWLLQSADRWLVFAFFDDRRTGLFALASSLGGIIPAMLAGTMLQISFPRVFRLADEAVVSGDWTTVARHCDRLTAVYLTAAVAGLLGLAGLGPHLVGWLVDARFAPALPLVLAAGMATVSVQVNQFYYLLLQGQQRGTKMVSVMSAVAGVKTLGSALAAWVSWECFLGWQCVSVGVSALLGRQLIRRAALGDA